MSYLIKDNKVIATTSETYKSGASVRVAWLRQGKTLVNAVSAKVSNAKKWNTIEAEHANLAIELSEGEFYAGDDKPKKIVVTGADIEIGLEIRKITGDEKDYSKLANTITTGFKNGKGYGDLQVDLQVMLGVSQLEADKILRLFKR
ncbi:hypothetical protein [Pseudoalteromonas luteoviolacea]|uniref:Uncharacterized protein n=1 Tax=Pseudoalteromonas luteoviolacea S4060-1 TaxID=1365257 RepID=A0A167KV42_9GAMM|nr:hypothetical protein [Pseudoalteromonas luteoviolacea]KZN63327.1 hypothetical protein N478_03495 [Pseudoalteromonas luteoviolacea S4060-1]